MFVGWCQRGGAVGGGRPSPLSLIRHRGPLARSFCRTHHHRIKLLTKNRERSGAGSFRTQPSDIILRPTDLDRYQE